MSSSASTIFLSLALVTVVNADYFSLKRLDQHFRAYISAARVEEAKRLLLESPDSSILDDALESGFNSKASFNRVFREATGLSPRDWRKRALRGI
jgi:AraC-like DNA-binding protein